MVDFAKISLPQSDSERDILELKARYTSVSHQTMQEVPWQITKAPTATYSRETRADMVKQIIPRYEAHAHAWQGLGSYFDRASPRTHEFIRKPINFISESRQTKYTPGYAGQVPLVRGEKGVPGIPLVKMTDVKRELPPATKVSRQANIVGYTGHVRPETTVPAHHQRPCTTSQLTHRPYPLGETQGMVHSRENPISNLVSLTHPYNPYNKLDPSIRQRI